MENTIELIQPYITSIVVAVVGILTTIVLGLLASLKTKVTVWIDTKTSASQRDLIHKIANEAFAHAESLFSSESGRVKLGKAFIYASGKLSNLGIKVSEDEVNAAIERACLEYNANKVKVVKENKAS